MLWLPNCLQRNYIGATGVVDKALALYPGVSRLIPGSSSLLDETLSHGLISMSYDEDVSGMLNTNSLIPMGPKHSVKKAFTIFGRLHF